MAKLLYLILCPYIAAAAASTPICLPQILGGYHLQNGILVPNPLQSVADEISGLPLFAIDEEFTVGIAKDLEYYRVLHLETYYYRSFATRVSTFHLRKGIPPETKSIVPFAVNEMHRSDLMRDAVRRYSTGVATYGEEKYKKYLEQWISSAATLMQKNDSLPAEFRAALSTIAERHMYQSRYVIVHELTPAMELGDIVATGRDILNPYRAMRLHPDAPSSSVDKGGTPCSRLRAAYVDPAIENSLFFGGLFLFGIDLIPEESFFDITLPREVVFQWVEEQGQRFQRGYGLHHDVGLITARDDWNRVGLSQVAVHLARFGVQPDFPTQKSYIAITDKTRRLHQHILKSDPVFYITRPLHEILMAGMFYKGRETPLDQFYSDAPIQKMGISWRIVETDIPTMLKRAYAVREEKPFYTEEQQRGMKSLLWHLSARDLIMGGVPAERVMEELNKIFPQ